MVTTLYLYTLRYLSQALKTVWQRCDAPLRQRPFVFSVARLQSATKHEETLHCCSASVSCITYALAY